MKTALLNLFKPSLLAAGIAAASLAMMPSSAQAFSILFGPDSFSSNPTRTGSSAKVNFNFSQVGSDVLLDLALTNTTGQIPTFGDGATESTLVGFGFDILDGLTFAYNPLSSTFTQLYGNSSLTSQTISGPATLQPFGTFDVGIRSAGPGDFNGGNPTQGLTAGQSTNVSFTLSGANLNAADVESEFLSGFQSGTLRVSTRFQSVNAGEGSDKLLGGNIVKRRVPEPATLAGIGLVAGVMVMSRRRQAIKFA
ncbi:MAG: PEP-CTERM sorting domain-containing protein [Trichormus sp. ATA11-4-KO1]|jgi:hypothetical protein|nr:PEP-CTERM sorting domain-containing protein [Trichormus sp. ATA11-4-KO1]